MVGLLEPSLAFSKDEGFHPLGWAQEMVLQWGIDLAKNFLNNLLLYPLRGHWRTRTESSRSSTTTDTGHYPLMTLPNIGNHPRT